MVSPTNASVTLSNFPKTEDSWKINRDASQNAPIRKLGKSKTSLLGEKWDLRFLGFHPR
jgi:hypothetical protein